MSSLWFAIYRQSDIIPNAIGAWRSLVARFNGVEEVVGSNPAAPTDNENGRFHTGNGRFAIKGKMIYTLPQNLMRFLCF